MADFLLYLILTSILGQSKPAQQSEDITRLNAGIHMSYKGSTQLVSAVWRHVAIIKLPETAQSNQFDISAHVRKTQHEHVQYSPDDGQYCQRARKQNDVSELCKKYKPQINLLHEISEDITAEIVQILINIYAVIPSRPETTQVRRGLGDFIGEGLSYIFGLATEKEVNLLKLTQQKAIAQRNEELQVLKRFSNDLTSYATQTNQAIAQLTNRIKEQAINQLHLVEMAKQTEDKIREYENNITLKLWKLTYHGLQYRMHLIQLQNAVEEMVSGIISPVLITPGSMEQMLNDISTHLQNTSFRLAFPRVDWFYRHVEFVAMQSNYTLYISLKIPLTTFETQFDVFRLETLPLPTHDGEGHITQLSNMPPAIALSKDRQYYVDMTLTELLDYRLQARGIFRPMVQKLTRESCLGAILESDAKDTAKYCQYIFELRGRRTSITLLNKSRLLLTHTNLTVVCDNGTQFIVNCESCVFEVPPDCQASNDQYHIAALQTRDEQNYENSPIKHTVNIVWLQAILAENKGKFLEDLDLTELINEQITILNLPTLQVLNDSLQEQFVSLDKNVMSLDAAAKALREDSRLLNSLEDAVYYSSMITSESWQDPIGILLIITTILATLTIIYLIGLSLYVKTLAVNLIILEAKATQVKAELIIDFLDKVTQNKTINPTSSYVILQEVHEKAAVTSTLLVIIIITFLLYRLWRKAQLKAKRWQLTFALQITTPTEFMLIRLHVLPGLAEDYRLEASQLIADIQIKDWMKRQLTYDWPHAQLRNILTSEVYHIEPEGYTIGIWQSYKLTQIIKQANYVCIPAILDKTRLHRMTTHLVNFEENNSKAEATYTAIYHRPPAIPPSAPIYPSIAEDNV